MKTIVSTLAIIASTAAFSGDQTKDVQGYICVGEKANGFNFNKSTRDWEHQTFQPGAKLVIARSKKEGAVWEVKEVGAPISSSFCASDFDEYGYLKCRGLVEFRFNKYSLRFLSATLFGFWNDANPRFKEKFPHLQDPEGNDAPGIEIGKCSSF